MFCSRERKELLKFLVKWFHISKLFQLSQYNLTSVAKIPGIDILRMYPSSERERRIGRYPWRHKTHSRTQRLRSPWPAVVKPACEVRNKDSRYVIAAQEKWKIILNHTDLGLELSTIFYEPYADCSSINLVVTLHSMLANALFEIQSKCYLRSRSIWICSLFFCFVLFL